MARPKTSLADRVARLSHLEGNHLIWDGPMRGRHPVMRDFGNPARVLLNLVDQPRISIRPTCLEPRCIEPHHWRVVVEKSFKYDDLPPPQWRDPRIDTGDFTDRELIDIEEHVPLLVSQEITVEDLDIFPEHVRAEIIARATSTS
ncbi:hypothetical protein [Mesorhizobium sp. B2-4-1]|uniref:hypothetical protein n=1 Tax=Mesorhizobium sp. B2-4-1 TaxID=2589948 RepID=UPI00112B0B91|nr:hypothetical protein [Mesorhizobium sp. B2-4-1]TPL66600.1 hypothetical protein FJ949_09545 [Mesorhizobium sp. B2-4-1]